MTERAPDPIILSLPDDLRGQLAQIAAERQTAEVDLVRTAVRRLVRTEQAPGVPRFARRLGPIAE